MTEIDNIKFVDDINEAIMLIKSKEILVAIIEKNKTYFVNKKEKVLVVNENSSYFLDFDSFKDIFKDNKFAIYEEIDSSFDFSRDDEYYSWKHK